MEIAIRITVPDELMRYTNKAFNKRSLCAIRSKNVFAPLNRLGEQKKICSCDDYATAERVAAAMNIAYPVQKDEAQGAHDPQLDLPMSGEASASAATGSGQPSKP